MAAKSKGKKSRKGSHSAPNTGQRAAGDETLRQQALDDAISFLQVQVEDSSSTGISFEDSDRGEHTSPAPEVPGAYTASHSQDLSIPARQSRRKSSGILSLTGLKSLSAALSKRDNTRYDTDQCDRRAPSDASVTQYFEITELTAQVKAVAF